MAWQKDEYDGSTPHQQLDVHARRPDGRPSRQQPPALEGLDVARSVEAPVDAPSPPDGDVQAGCRGSPRTSSRGASAGTPRARRAPSRSRASRKRASGRELSKELSEARLRDARLSVKS
eukprot:4396021-Prymnesium_polylepis.1